MKMFTAKIEMRGRPVGIMIGFALFILFFAVACAVMSFYGAAPAWFGWLMSTLCSVAGLSLLTWAGFCVWRHVEWSFEAGEEKIIWFWTDRSGEEHGRKEVAVCDVVEVLRSRGSSGIPGGLYLRLRSGDSVDIGGVAQPESSFLEWVSINYPRVNLKIE